MLYWFELWREFKLSISEILSVFSTWKVIYSEKSVLILDWLTQEKILWKANFLGWVIKIFELNIKSDLDDIFDSILNYSKNFDWKFNYWINLFWDTNLQLSKVLINTKRFLKQNNISSRFVNKNDKNLSSAQIIWNNLIKRWIDFNIIDLWGIFYFWKTIWVQDINAYSARDYWKSRDMDIWMLPPKLSQIMINLSRNNWNDLESIYDPFVWLWTILIEWAYMWIKKLYWSDFNPKMIQESKSNLWNLKSKLWKIDTEIIEFDARDMNENPILKNNKIDSIVSEGFLWEVMTQKNINMDRINIQKKNLLKLYEKFFNGLNKVWFSGNIVISFPFWDLKWKYVFFEEVYNVLDNCCEILPLFPSEFDFKETKSWSLLYKRQKQLVWREIFKLRIRD